MEVGGWRAQRQKMRKEKRREEGRERGRSMLCGEDGDGRLSGEGRTAERQGLRFLLLGARDVVDFARSCHGHR